MDDTVDVVDVLDGLFPDCILASKILCGSQNTS